jgi:hypothetical protein
VGTDKGTIFDINYTRNVNIPRNMVLMKGTEFLLDRNFDITWKKVQ